MNIKTVSLGEVCEILDSLRKPITKKFRKSGVYPYYGATGIVDYVDNYIFDETLVLIGEDGAKWNKGEQTAFIATGKYWVNNHAHVVRPLKNKLNQKFLVYYLNSIDLKPWVTGLTVPKLNQEKLKSISIPLFSIEEQNNIVSKVDSAYTEIDKINKFEEIKIKQTEITIQKYLDKIFKSKKNLKKLSNCVEINPPKSELNNLDDDLEVSFMPMKDMGINNLLANPNQIRKLKDVKQSYTYFSEGDVLLAKITPCFENGKMGIATNLLNGVGFGSSEYFVFKPNKILTKEWLYYFLNRNEFRINGAQNMLGAVGHKRVSKDFISNSLIPIPSLEEQRKIIFNLKNLSTYLKVINENMLKKINQLNFLKQSILKKLLNNNLLDKSQ
jgi:type I restriction enzyme, S subunit